MLFARFVEDVWVVRIIGVMGLIGISVLPFDLGIGLKYLAVFAIWYVCAIVADEMKFNEAMEKIEKDPSNPQYIQTAFGKGYIFNKAKLI